MQNQLACLRFAHNAAESYGTGHAATTPPVQRTMRRPEMANTCTSIDELWHCRCDKSGTRIEQTNYINPGCVMPSLKRLAVGMRRYCGGYKLQKAALWLHMLHISSQTAVCTINACHTGACSWVKAKVVAAMLLKAAYEKRRREKQKCRTVFGRSQFPPADAKRRLFESAAEIFQV